MRMGYEKERMIKRITVIMLVLSLLTCTACNNGNTGKDSQAGAADMGETIAEATDGVANEEESAGSDDVEKEDLPPLNMIDDKYRNFYEIFVYSFCDSDGDGIGDIQGVISKLDYLNDGNDETDTDLGVTGIWLMPIAQSTTYHKYDVVDYKSIDKEYGTLEDFQQLLDECHNRGIKVIIDLVINHSSSKNEWFIQATDYIKGLDGKEPSVEECRYFDYYNFTKETGKKAYTQVGNTEWYYESQFWSEMPDLNLESELLREELAEVTQFWFDMGVDGFRLDAVGEFYTGETERSVEVLTWFVDMVKQQKEDVYLVGEAWDAMEVYSRFYASGIDSMFNFDFSQQSGIIADSVKKMNSRDAETYGKRVDALAETFGQYSDTYIDAPFYTNHDTARSAGYYFGEYGDAQTKIAGAMNLFMSGASFLYYGEELGMKGSGRDENKRAPMQWSSDPAAEGMCDGPKDMEEVIMKYGSLEEQKEDPNSVYNYYKKVIHYKNAYPEIARGVADYVEELSNQDICVISKSYNDEKITIIYNISQNENAVDISGLQSETGELTVCGSLLTGDTEAVLNGNQLQMPAYSVVLMK